MVRHGATGGVVGDLLQHRDATQALLLLLVPAERGGVLSGERGADGACERVGSARRDRASADSEDSAVA